MAACLVLLLAATLAIAPFKEKEAEASSESCLVGVLFTGGGAIALAAFPPAGLAYWVSFGLLGGQTAYTVYDCINGSDAGASVGHPCKNMTSSNNKQSYWQSCHFAGGGGGGGGGGSW